MITKILNDSKNFLTADQLSQLEEILKKHFGKKNIDEDLIDMFLNSKRLECCSEKTLEQYEGRLRYFQKCIEVTDLRYVTKDTIRNYLSNYQKKGISTRTLNNMRLYLSTFYQWLEDEDIITKSPVRSIKSIKTKKVVKVPFTPMDIIQLREQCNSLREIAVFETLLSTGCRVSELVNIKISEINNDETIICGKGNKERKVYFSDNALFSIRNYLRSRNDECDYLFVSEKGKEVHPVTTTTIRRTLHELSIKTGIENVHPHRFRRTLATKLLNKGMPVQEVAAILGHAKLETTMLYCEVDQEQVKSNHYKYVV